MNRMKRVSPLSELELYEWVWQTHILTFKFLIILFF